MPRSLFIVFIGIVFFALSFGSLHAGGQMSSLVMSACTECHSAKPMCDALGKKSQSDWENTIQRMVEMGANVPSDMQQPMAAWFSAQQPGSAPLCQ